MNRDWHNRPLQGDGRDAWDYGRTDLHRETPMTLFGWPLVAVLTVFAVVTLGCVLAGGGM